MYRVPKKQFKLWLEEETVERLSSTATKHGRSSAQEVVEELIALYLPVWSTVNTATIRAVDLQTKMLIKEEVKGHELSPTGSKIPLYEPRDEKKSRIA